MTRTPSRGRVASRCCLCLQSAQATGYHTHINKLTIKHLAPGGLETSRNNDSICFKANAVGEDDGVTISAELLNAARGDEFDLSSLDEGMEAVWVRVALVISVGSPEQGVGVTEG